MADITISSDPIGVGIAQEGSPHFGDPFVRHPELDITFYCNADDRFGNPDAGIIVVTLEPLGEYFNKTIWSNPITVTITPLGFFPGGVLVTANPIVVTVGFSFGFGPYHILTELFKKNWVKWSNIGSLDFTIGKDNIAGERPLDWKGWVYEIKKLGNKVIAYGENGVSALTPSNNAYGLDTIYRIGLKGKQAVAGDEVRHFFIDKEGKLWSLSESLEMLDYSEYLANLNSPVLSWDAKNKLLYICDGVLGFIYSLESKSLGKGPVNITGISYQGGTLYVVAPTTIATPTFEIWTDIYDMGTRKGKSITSLEFGIDLAVVLKASIKYRSNKAVVFSRTDWYTVDSRGLVFIQCYGQEFCFGAKADTYEWFKPDYVKVNGKVYDSW